MKSILTIFNSLFIFLLLTCPQVYAESSAEFQEIDSISTQLKLYFEEIGEISDSNEYHIYNYDLFEELLTRKDPIAQKIYEIYFLNDEININSPKKFAKCVVGKFIKSYGSIARAFLTGAIYTYIKKKEWDLAARLMFKTLKAAGFKTNAASLAIEAAIYGWQCRKKWANKQAHWNFNP
jgi:hypothetical protein